MSSSPQSETLTNRHIGQRVKITIEGEVYIFDVKALASVDKDTVGITAIALMQAGQYVTYKHKLPAVYQIPKDAPVEVIANLSDDDPN